MDTRIPYIHLVRFTLSMTCPRQVLSINSFSLANTTGAGGWEAAMAKAQAFVAELTLEEKTNMVTGTPGPCVGNIIAIERLGFPGLCLQDGPLAIRVASYASVFSAGVSAAASWDKDILYERGYALGEEFKGKGAHILLG